MQNVQYTIRNIPKDLDQMLRKKARQESKSLNAMLIEIIMLGAGLRAEPREYHDLDFLFGSWVEDPEFDKAIADFEKIDEELWVNDK